MCVTVIKPPKRTAPSAAGGTGRWNAAPACVVQASWGRSVSAQRAKNKSATAGEYKRHGEFPVKHADILNVRLCVWQGA